MLFAPSDRSPEEARRDEMFAARTIVDRGVTTRRDIARMMTARPRTRS